MNWEPINQLVDECKSKQEIDGEDLFANLKEHVAIAEDLYARGWPEDEVILSSGFRLDGIPVELAGIIYLVLQFAADHGIDLSGCMKEAEHLSLAS